MPRRTRRTADDGDCDEPRVATPETAATDEQRSFNRLWARIEASESASPASGAASDARPTMRSSRTVRWLAAAVVIQGFGLALFGFNALRDAFAAKSITVADERPAPRLNAPAVRIVFAPDASIATINTLLAHQGLSIVVRARDRGQFHRGAVGRCGSLGRLGEFRRRRDLRRIRMSLSRSRLHVDLTRHVWRLGVAVALAAAALVLCGAADSGAAARAARRPRCAARRRSSSWSRSRIRSPAGRRGGRHGARLRQRH